MNLGEVARRVDEIESVSGDPEAAHSLEDSLWKDVLEAIADGHPYPQLIAAKALETHYIPFARWCA